MRNDCVSAGVSRHEGSRAIQTLDPPESTNRPLIFQVVDGFHPCPTSFRRHGVVGSLLESGVVVLECVELFLNELGVFGWLCSGQVELLKDGRG